MNEPVAHQRIDAPRPGHLHLGENGQVQRPQPHPHQRLGSRPGPLAAVDEPVGRTLPGRKRACRSPRSASPRSMTESAGDSAARVEAPHHRLDGLPGSTAARGAHSYRWVLPVRTSSPRARPLLVLTWISPPTSGVRTPYRDRAETQPSTPPASMARTTRGSAFAGEYQPRRRRRIEPSSTQSRITRFVAPARVKALMLSTPPTASLQAARESTSSARIAVMGPMTRGPERSRQDLWKTPAARRLPTPPSGTPHLPPTARTRHHPCTNPQAPATNRT